MNNLQADIKAELEKLPLADQKIINELLIDIENDDASQRQLREIVVQKVQQMIVSEE
ncbi:hypothetical protein LPAF129_14380 [Ligilactobacillus pabuli]|uniref:Uncharacterized protein n=1 Tax=Ligilactobacillus pabuli TaxID=2886039 RepID=A0ABQ5JKH1_9LACO|nr:hypothetical protein [Ligilactobacillus pabuli]GKS81752.1 hypothetical protein LPAF129_14380 [Ligilactobacillus pabuli]